MTNGTFLQPVFQERLWGGTNLTQFGYDIPNNSTGECWVLPHIKRSQHNS